MAISNTQVVFDNLYGIFTYLAIVVGVIVFALMTYLVIRYRDKASATDPEDTPRLGRIPMSRGHGRNVLITITLSTILLAVLIISSFAAVDYLFPNNPPTATWCYGIASFNQTRISGQSCPRIDVIGHQFYWDFRYPNNNVSKNLLIVPVNSTVVLDVTSADVFHDFGIIQFKIKTDAIQGRTNTIWFIPYQVDNYTIQCFELCGDGHPGMIARLQVVKPANFTSWYRG